MLYTTSQHQRNRRNTYENRRNNVGFKKSDINSSNANFRQTKKGNQRKQLKPGDKPVAQFALLPGEELLAALEYCNLHGLYKK